MSTARTPRLHFWPDGSSVDLDIFQNGPRPEPSPKADPWAMTAKGESLALPEAPTHIGPNRPGRLEGTAQQEAFWAELTDGSDHVLLEARAGTGKSTSCREGMYRLFADDPRLAIRYCCFNRKIADEFAAKCPPQADVNTMHAFGNMLLGQKLGAKMERNKTYLVLDSLPGGANLKRYKRSSINKLVSLAKNHALRPEDDGIEERLEELIDAYDVEAWNDRAGLVDWSALVLQQSAKMTSLIDFDDMLWMPVLMGLAFPQVDFLFIDEAQDLNPLQHEMADLMCSSGRIIVVGDPYQSIYAFRGADSQSIPKLRDRLAAKVMPLTVTFRCPRLHVELAQRIVPDFECAAGAPDGELEYADAEQIEGAEPGDMILCRTNAPLIALCLRAVARRMPATVRGRALGDGLLSVIRKAKADSATTVAEFGKRVADWHAREVFRLEARDGTEPLIEKVNDQADCLHAISEACSNPAEVAPAIAELFSDDLDSSSRLTFSTVHRAKGSEARVVRYIDVPYSAARDKRKPPMPWELQQRRNLAYVARTRSLDYLSILSPPRT